MIKINITILNEILKCVERIEGLEIRNNRRLVN